MKNRETADRKAPVSGPGPPGARSMSFLLCSSPWPLPAGITDTSKRDDCQISNAADSGRRQPVPGQGRLLIHHPRAFPPLPAQIGRLEHWGTHEKMKGIVVIIALVP